MAPQAPCTPPKRGLLTQIAPSHFRRQRFIPNKHVILQIGLQVEEAPSPVLGSNGSHNATALPAEEENDKRGESAAFLQHPGARPLRQAPRSPC